MSPLSPSPQLIQRIECSEIDYMTDRMLAIRDRAGNPEGIEVRKFGNAVCLYSKTMPWATFNTVKGLRSEDADALESIIDFYKSRARKVQFEIVPSLVDQPFLKRLSELGYYQSGFHASLYIEPAGMPNEESSDRVTVRELDEDQFELYATIHCRGTGLPDDGIPHVASNNRVLYNRPGWKFFVAYYDEVPAAVSVIYMNKETASFTFAATLPNFRNLGLHRSLLKRRMEVASQNHCTIAVSQCSFLSRSHRNMEWAGMRLGYVRTSWTEK